MPYKNKKTQYGLIRLYPYRVVELYRSTVFRLGSKYSKYFYIIPLSIPEPLMGARLRQE